MKWRIWISILVVCVRGMGEVEGENEGVVGGMIGVYREKGEKEVKNEEKVMVMERRGDIWRKEEVEGRREVEGEFNKYVKCLG